ncbi:hypothetical protein FRC07_010596 [Ceratobasidium sp. 392]|nr:hypothetical protein FRC07_010596 [Ceratobasidium sp. 392]
MPISSTNLGQYENSQPATLELNNIVVTLGNAATDDSKHEALRSYEYNGPKDDNEVVCWVPVEPKSQFCVHIGYDGRSLPYPDAGLGAQIHIDGVGPLEATFVSPKDIQARIKQRTSRKKVTTGEMEMTGQEIGNGYIRPFYFSLRKTTESEDDVPPENMEELGNIHVLVCWEREIPYIKKESGTEEDFSLLAKPLNEKLKCVQHQLTAGLGERQRDCEASGRKEPNDTKPVNEVGIFWLQFTFKYRSIDWLRMSGIAP